MNFLNNGCRGRVEYIVVRWWHHTLVEHALYFSILPNASERNDYDTFRIVTINIYKI